MANAVCFTCVTPGVKSPAKPLASPNPKTPLFSQNQYCPRLPSRKPTPSLHPLKASPTDDSNIQGTKPNSILCADCDGNGAKLCTQCKGAGVNSVDHFNGQFKAGGLCWLCRGKRDILCGSCNGAGFLGGFMSTRDD